MQKLLHGCHTIRLFHLSVIIKVWCFDGHQVHETTVLWTHEMKAENGVENTFLVIHTKI